MELSFNYKTLKAEKWAQFLDFELAPRAPKICQGLPVCSIGMILAYHAGLLWDLLQAYVEAL